MKSILIAVILSASLAHAQQLEIGKTNRVITVNAIGKASSVADQATVHIGYVVYGADKEAAYRNGSNASSAVMDALLRSGVPRDNIESETQTIAESQPYEYANLSPDEARRRAYRVQQSWTVRVTAGDANKLLDTAVKAGANAGGQIDWSMYDPDALHAKAQADAMRRAASQAEVIAHGMGVKLGALLQASNQPEWSGGAVGGILGGIGTGAGMAGGAYQPANQPVPLRVSPKKIEDSATIYAVYAIE